MKLAPVKAAQKLLFSPTFPIRRLIVLLALLAAISYSINVSGCMQVSSSGTYDLINNIQGANISTPEYDSAGMACLKIVANNVVLDCHGFNVTDNMTNNSRYGIVVESNYTTVRNCVVSGYNGSSASGIAVIQNSSIVVSRRILSPIFTNVTCFNNYYGFFTYNYDSASGNYGTRNLTLANSTFYENQYGVYMSSYAFNFTLINNNASNNNYSGFYTINLVGNNARIINNTASYNRGNTSGSAGFYMDGLNYNISYINNTAIGNGYYGLYYRSMDSIVANNVFNNNGNNGMYYFLALTGPSSNIVNNNTANRNNGSGMVQTGYIEPGSFFSYFNNTASFNGQDGHIIYGYISGSILNNTAENNSGSGIRYTSYYGGNGGLAINATFNGNRVYNNTEGFSVYTGATLPSNMTFLGNSALENTHFDFYITAYGIGTAPYCDVIHLVNLTSSGGRPIIFLNESGIIRDYDVAELILCDTDNSKVTNITIHGSDLIHNNGILLHMTDNTTFENFTMSDDYASFDFIQSHRNRFQNISVTGSTLGVMNYPYFVNPLYGSSTNNSFTNLNFTRCGTAYFFTTNAYGSVNVSGGLIQNSTGPGFIDNTSIVMFNGTRFCNNYLDSQTNGIVTYLSLNLTNVVFDSPSCNLTNFANLSLYDSGVANFTMNWSAQPATPPAGFLQFKGFLNLTKLGTTTIDSVVFRWRDNELGGLAENLFRLYKYNGTWTAMNSSPNTAANTLSLSSLSSFSGFGILGNDSAPSVTLIAPLNGTHITSDSLNLSFNTSDNSATLNCTLYLDSVANKTNSSVVTGEVTNFTLTGVSFGLHPWYVKCTDAASNIGTSATRYFSIDINFTNIQLYGTNVTNSTQYRWGGESAANLSLNGGNLTNSNISTTMLTDHWAGFFGNISAGILLASSATNIVYSWEWDPSSGGVICASTNSTLSVINATGGKRSDIDSAWGFSPSASDSANRTFSGSNCTQDFNGITVGGADFADTGNAGGFMTCAYKTKASPAKQNLIFCGNITEGGVFYNGQIGDFELIVPTAAGPATETYYFYLSLP